MAGFDQIVVALGSPTGDRSLIAYAALLARLGAAREVRFAHVADPSESAAELREAMRAEVEPVFRETPSRTVCDVLHGSLTDRLLAYTTEMQADLVMIGAKKHKLGARLAMTSPCSVAVIPNDHPASLTHLMVAFDFSSAALDTVQWATALAAADPSVRCTALHVITHESVDMFADNETEAAQAETMARILEAADRHGVNVTSRLAAVTRSFDVSQGHRFSLPGSIEGMDIAHTILVEAERGGADCIALATRGRSRSASILLGSVTEKLIERARVPLLVRKHSSTNLGLASILLGRTGRHEGIKAN
jgi:sulfate permease, SulP family